MLEAVGLVVVLALAAVEAGVGLGADADTLAGLDESYFGTDAEGGSDDFYGWDCQPVTVVMEFTG